MRLYVCSPSQLFFLVAGLALGVLLTTTRELFTSCQYEELNAVKRSVHHGCVCGKEMLSLQRLAELYLYERPLNLSVGVGEPTASAEGVAAMSRFLEPPDGDTILTYKQLKKKAYRPGSKKEPLLLSEEYIFKKDLFVGVLTQQAYLSTRALSVYETWGKEVDKLVFFVGEDCNISAEYSHLPIVKLKGVPDAVYPPLRKSFAVMMYMYQHYVSQFNWFIRADDDMYIRTNKLKDLLRKMHPYESVYLGRAGTGRKVDLERLKLLSHERYCMGGPGIILSVGAMRLVGPHLDNCLQAVLYHDEQTGNAWNDDDVEIGRCLSRKTNIQCSSSVESRKYFKFDYHGDILRPLTLWTKPHFRELISVHPVKNPHNMRSIHHFYTTLEFESKYEELYGLVGYLNELCTTLPSHVAPPKSASSGCDLKLHPHLAYFNHSSIGNFIGTSPGNHYIIPLTQIPFIHNPRDKFDLSPWIRFNNSLIQEIVGYSPQHAPYTSFRSEMTHLLKQLAPYIASQCVPHQLVGTTIIDGYTRFNPHLGREYYLSLKILLEGRTLPEFKRFHLIRELGPRLSLIEKPLSSLMSPTVYVILPVERTDEGLKGFLASYVQTAVKHGGNQVHLVAVVFSEQHGSELEEELKEFSTTSVPVAVTIAIGEGSFNHLRAIEVGMSALESGSLAFLANVDIRFGTSFFIRCRSNTIRNEKVYFPIAFKLFSSQYKQSSFEDHQPPLTAWTGQWGVYNLGLVCIYKDDYGSIGGYRDSKYIVELFERVSAVGLEVMQAPEPGLYQLPSGKTCRELKSNSQREGCQRLKQVGLVDQTELSEYLGELNSLKNPLVFTAEDESNS